MAYLTELGYENEAGNLQDTSISSDGDISASTNSDNQGELVLVNNSQQHQRAQKLDWDRKYEVQF
jgi:hypothetical protein